MARIASVTQANLATSPAQLVLLAIPGFLESSAGWLIALALMLVCSLWLWRANFRRARAVEDTPTSKIASAHQGYVELVGAACLGKTPLAAPLTGRQCVWYRYRVEKKGSKNKWITERSGSSDNPFLVDGKQHQSALHERFDLDRDGAVDEREWDLARRAAQREVQRRHREIMVQPVTHVLRKPDAGRPFLVSNLDPAKLGRRHRLWQWLHLVLALTAGGAIVAMTGGLLPLR